MKQCERCFWLEKHKRWKRPAGIMPSLPSGMDRILKKHFDRFREKGVLPPELRDHASCKDLMLFDDVRLLKTWMNVFTGVSWKDEDGNVFHGAVDNILVHGKKLIVMDYKTRGFQLKENTADLYQHQLDAYTFLLYKNGYETEDYGFLLFYVPKEVLETGEVIFDTELVKRKVTISSAEKLFKKALLLLEGECPKKSCEWCKGR